jgi:hypothetical protein
MQKPQKIRHVPLNGVALSTQRVLKQDIKLCLFHRQREDLYLGPSTNGVQGARQGNQ